MNYLSYKPQPTKQIHSEMAVPFEVYLLNTGCKANYVRHQALVQYRRKGSKTMEINAFGQMNKPMQEAYAEFLSLYFKLGKDFITLLRSRVVKVAA